MEEYNLKQTVDKLSEPSSVIVTLFNAPKAVKEIHI